MNGFEQSLSMPVQGLLQAEKDRWLLLELRQLVNWHRERCAMYGRIVDALFPDAASAKSLEELPYLPASLFKTHRLQSVPDDGIRLWLRSSGTSGQTPSQIAVDDVTARRQARALVASMKPAVGGRRLPLLIADSENVLQRGSAFNARAAGILGFLSLGHDPLFALDEAGALREDAVRAFLDRHARAPFLVFGFTWLVWSRMFSELERKRLRLDGGILVHGGGWKKLAHEAVGPAEFRRRALESIGLERVHSYYGMVEQMGTAYLEGEDGLLYAPPFADVVIRDPVSLRALPPGEVGLVQTLSLVPTSYPGHSILTEDLGRVVSIDAGAGGRLGKAIEVLGRAPQVEIRGCSDTMMDGRLNAAAGIGVSG
jgi:hypothetical protein